MAVSLKLKVPTDSPFLSAKTKPLELIWKGVKGLQGEEPARTKGTALTTAPCHTLPVCSPSSLAPMSWTRSQKSMTSSAHLLRRPSPSSNSKYLCSQESHVDLSPCWGWWQKGTEGGRGQVVLLSPLQPLSPLGSPLPLKGLQFVGAPRGPGGAVPQHHESSYHLAEGQAVRFGHWDTYTGLRGLWFQAQAPAVRALCPGHPHCWPHGHLTRTPLAFVLVKDGAEARQWGLPREGPVS